MLALLNSYLRSCCEGVRQFVEGTDEFIRCKLLRDVERFSIYFAFVAAVHCSYAAKMPAQT